MNKIKILIVIGSLDYSNCITNYAINYYKKIDKNKSYFLIPYILWNIFAFILSISIIILN